MITYDDSKKISTYLRNKVKDKIEVTDFGATIVPKGKKLSKGCYACKTGSWICVYIGVSCNLKCVSCPQISRHHVNEYIWANGGDDNIHSLEDLKRTIDNNERITGISFSGGEPFLYLDLVHDWLNFINENFAHLNLYKWIYTNAELVTKEKCEKLKELGINEIRFDLAATNYSNRIIDKLEYCKTIFDKISVEVPVEPWRTDKLIGSLKRLDEVGLDYLNLHELNVCSDNKSRLIDGGYVDENMIYEAPTGEHYLPSIFDVYKIVDYIEDNNLSIIYNDCSAKNMVFQSMGWQYQRNIQNPELRKESWEIFVKRAEENGHIP